MADEFIQIDVAYATPDKQLVIPLKVRAGTSLYDAVLQSGIAARFPGLDIESATLGVFGKAERSPRERILIEGERAEIYRPLIADPKEVRKKRAAAKGDVAE